ncbi:MAG: sugar nucleotide-binding protein [Microthrixaceae bacterium]
MRVLVTGGAGLVGSWLARTAPEELAGSPLELHLTVRRSAVPADAVRQATVHTVELSDAAAVADLLDRVRPDVVVHTAYTQSSREDVVVATEVVAGAAAGVGAALVFTSTDVVFAGDRPPYAEDARPDPVTDYGRWKLEAERAALAAVPDAAITRTSLVVALDPPDRGTAGMADTWRAGRPVRLFHDELRQPIRVEDLVAELWAILALRRAERAGIWHLPGPEKLSRLVLGERMAAALSLGPVPILSASAADHPSPRPGDPELVPGRRGLLGVELRAVDDPVGPAVTAPARAPGPPSDDHGPGTAE